jgi:hypothetical protein
MSEYFYEYFTPLRSPLGFNCSRSKMFKNHVDPMILNRMIQLMNAYPVGSVEYNNWHDHIQNYIDTGAK